MKNKKNTLFVIVIVTMSLLIAALLGYIIYDKVINKDTVKIEEKKTPEKSNEYFEELLEAYKYVPSNFEIDSIDDEFLLKFAVNYYTMYDKTYLSTGNYENDKWFFELPKKVVTRLIEKYFYINNKTFNENYTYDGYSIENKENNYKIIINPAGFDMVDEKIKKIKYNNNYVTVNYELINPNNKEVVGNKIIKLKYKDSKFKIQSLKTSITSENW